MGIYDSYIVYIVFVFPMFSTLELRNKEFGPQILILREISSLELAPEVWKTKSRPQNPGFIFLSRKYKVGFYTYSNVSEVPELYRKLRKACRNNFHQVSSKSVLVTPS